MFKLTIRKADDSIYWTEHFNSMSELNKWLNEEQTRHYWQSDFVPIVEDLTPPPPSQEEIDRENQRKADILALRTRLSELHDLPDLNPTELKEAAIKLLKFLKLQGQI